MKSEKAKVNAEGNRPLTLLRLPEVIRRSGKGRSEIYRCIAARTFPAPVKLGRSSAWPEHEVTEWCEARIQARNAKPAG